MKANCLLKGEIAGFISSKALERALFHFLVLSCYNKNSFLEHL